MYQIEIPKRAATCFKGGESFAQGVEYYSALVRGEHDDTYHRQDYCLDCWEKIQIQSKLPGSCWKSAVPIKKETSELPKKRDARALMLLKEVLKDQDTSHKMAEAFVLALYLARRRLIFLRQEVRNVGKLPLCIYEVAETEEMLCVPKISLSELQVEDVQSELAKKFSA